MTREGSAMSGAGRGRGHGGTRVAALAAALAAAAVLAAAPAGAKGRPGGGGGKAPKVSHTAPQSGAIQLGTSGGWGHDLANGYCCGGTLGSLVHIGSTQYILSNYHVFRSDIVPGGKRRRIRQF